MLTKKYPTATNMKKGGVKEFGNKQARRKNIILTVFYPIHVYKYTTNLALALKWGKALVSFFCASGPCAPRGNEISTIRPSCQSASRNFCRGMMSTPGSSRTTLKLYMFWGWVDLLWPGLLSSSDRTEWTSPALCNPEEIPEKLSLTRCAKFLVKDRTFLNKWQDI